jgi:hypothetical protein
MALGLGDELAFGDQADVVGDWCGSVAGRDEGSIPRDEHAAWMSSVM